MRLGSIGRSSRESKVVLCCGCRRGCCRIASSLSARIEGVGRRVEWSQESPTLLILCRRSRHFVEATPRPEPHLVMQWWTESTTAVSGDARIFLGKVLLVRCYMLEMLFLSFFSSSLCPKSSPASAKWSERGFEARVSVREGVSQWSGRGRLCSGDGIAAQTKDMSLRGGREKVNGWCVVEESASTSPIEQQQQRQQKGSRVWSVKDGTAEDSAQGGSKNGWSLGELGDLGAAPLSGQWGSYAAVLYGVVKAWRTTCKGSSLARAWSSQSLSKFDYSTPARDGSYYSTEFSLQP